MWFCFFASESPSNPSTSYHACVALSVCSKVFTYDRGGAASDTSTNGATESEVDGLGERSEPCLTGKFSWSVCVCVRVPLAVPSLFCQLAGCVSGVRWRGAFILLLYGGCFLLFRWGFCFFVVASFNHSTHPPPITLAWLYG